MSSFARKRSALVAVALAIVATTVASSPASATPSVVSSASFKSVSVGTNFTCTLSTVGVVACLGDNIYGQLGDGSDQLRTGLTAVTGGAVSGKTVKQVSSGEIHTCALLSDGSVSCWGGSTFGQVGFGSYAMQITPVVISGGALTGKTVTQISAGEKHTCALLSDGTVACWGYNVYGQVGTGTGTTTYLSPVAITGGALTGKTVVQIAAGGYHTCALLSDGTVACWGYNVYGSVGDGANTSKNTPTAVTGGALNGKTVKQVAVGTYHSCALISDGTIACWGYNTYGQLGDVSTESKNLPTAIDTGALIGERVTQLALGGDHTCALLANGRLACWGANTYGQVGDGTESSQYAPTLITGGALAGKKTLEVGLGANNTCAIISDGTIACWGNDLYGQLGDGNSALANVPMVLTIPSRAAITEAPSVPHSATAGDTIDANSGTWTGTPAPTLEYRWLACNREIVRATQTLPAGCLVIGGAETSSLDLTANQAGKYVAVGVVATSVGTLPTIWISASTTSAILLRPSATKKPSITGVARIGEGLAASKGTWTGFPSPKFTYQWYTCSARVAAEQATTPVTCKAITGATNSVLTLTSAHTGSYVTVRVTASSTGTAATSWFAKSTTSKVS